LVKLAVEAIDADQAKHTAEIEYQVRPEAIPVLYFWQDAPDNRFDEREHGGISLKPGELLADGEDEVGVGAFLARADQAGDFLQVYENPLELAQPPQADLRGVNSQRYLLEPETASDNCNRYAGRLRARELILYQGQEHGLEVRLNLSFDARRYPNYFRPDPAAMRITINPLDIYLKLWVLPGGEAATSDAGALLYAPAKKAPLAGVNLSLDIQSHGGGALTANQATGQTNQDGMALWTLSYSGLTWRNYQDASFTVRCGAPAADGGYTGTQVQIDIGRNVHTMLADLHAERKSKVLDLDNPDWESGSGFLAFVGDLCFPDFLSGPCVNFVGFFTGKEHYVCSEMRDRVLEWLQRRRYASFNRKLEEGKHASMNGIEYANYSIWFLGPINHNFAGIYLSDQKRGPLDDPRFPDPWWEQHWSSESVKYPNGLYTKAQEHALQATTLMLKGALATLVTIFAGWKFGPAAVATLKPKIWKAFAALSTTNIARGIYLGGEVTRCGQNIERARRSFISDADKPVPRVEPIIRW
jgi:hypothetical protein